MTAAIPARPASGVIPSLDGIRAVAVSLVFLAHSGLERVIPGGLGVTIFFVLSGYLISTLLRVEHAATRRIDYRNFYLRRFLRLMPPLAVIVTLVALLGLTPWVESFSLQGLLSVLFYYGNYFVIAHDFQGLPDGIGVVWSLAVEEHYYLLYPPLAAVLLGFARPALSAATLLALCLMVLGWRYWLASHGASEDYLTMATDTRIDAILIGCMMALWRNPWLDPPRNAPARDAVLIGCALFVLLFTLLFRDDFFRVTYRYGLQSGAIAVLLYFAIARAQTWPFRWLNSRPLVYIGAISYSIYLSHHFVMQTISRHWPQLNWLISTALAVVIVLALAATIRRWIELPCARLRARLHRPRQPNSVAGPISGGNRQVLTQVTPGGTL